MSAFSRPSDDPTNPYSTGVPPLTFRGEDGKLYQRSNDVEEDILRSLYWAEEGMLRNYKTLFNEALFFNIRRFRGRNEHVCGVLMLELAQRVTRIAKSALRGLDRLGKADIAMQVELEILELAIAPEPSRKSEFMEVAFTLAVRRRVLQLRKKLKGTAEGNRGRYKIDPRLELDENEKKKRELEFVPDSRNTPEAAMLAFQDEQFREEAYEMVKTALQGEDERFLTAFQLAVVDGWPISSNKPNVPNIADHFGLTRPQARHLMKKIQNIIDGVLSRYRARQKQYTAGGRI